MPGFLARRFPLSNLSRESGPWGREVEERITALESSAGRNGVDNLNANKGQNSTMEALSRQIRAMPIPVSGYGSLIGQAAGSVSRIDIPIAVPPNKTKVTVTAIANVYLTANSSVGYFGGYIQANGVGFRWETPYVDGTDAASLFGFGHSLNIALGFTQETLDPFIVTLFFFPNDPTYFPAISANFANLTVNAIFHD